MTTDLLLYLNAVLLIIMILIGGFIMDALKTAITALQTAITALQGRIGTGVIVQQSDLDAATTAVNAAATTLGTIAA